MCSTTSSLTQVSWRRRKWRIIFTNLYRIKIKHIYSAIRATFSFWLKSPATVFRDLINCECHFMLTETHYLSLRTRNHQWKWPSIIWILSRTQSNNDEPQPEASKRRQRTKLKDWMRPLLFFPALSVSKKHGPFEVYVRSVHWWHLQSRQSPQPYSDTLQTTRQGLMDK